MKSVEIHQIGDSAKCFVREANRLDTMYLWPDGTWHGGLLGNYFESRAQALDAINSDGSLLVAPCEVKPRPTDHDIHNTTDLAVSYAQTIDKVAEALQCEPQQVQVVATALECSLRIAKHDFMELRRLSETCCEACGFDNDLSKGVLSITQCDACCQRIATELYRRMHTPPQPDPAETPDVYLVARCRNCGAVGAAQVIDVDPGSAIDLGQIAQKSVRGFLVRIEPGPVAISGCQCEDAQRLRKTVRDYSK